MTSRIVQRAAGALRNARRHGLRLHLRRLVEAPRVEASRVEASTPDGVSLRLSGVVCAVCATRTESALRSVPGVEAATVDLDGSRASLRLSPGAQVDVPALQRALEGVVVGMGVRRRIEWVAHLARRVRPRLATRTSE